MKNLTTLESETLSTLLQLTNDFIMTNILPISSNIEIITQQQPNKWISIIQYNKKESEK